MKPVGWTEGSRAASAEGGATAQPQPWVRAAHEAAVRVRAFDERDRERWDRFVATSAEATFFHRAAWHGIVENEFRHRCH